MLCMAVHEFIAEQGFYTCFIWVDYLFSKYTNCGNKNKQVWYLVFYWESKSKYNMNGIDYGDR